MIPPLRERTEDIPLLIEHFARALPFRRRFAPSAVAVMAAYSWPGNVRELSFAVERIGLLADREVIEADDLPPEFEAPPIALRRAAGEPAPSSEPTTTTRERVIQALEQTRWHRGRAAFTLGVSARTLHRWMKRLGL